MELLLEVAGVSARARRTGALIVIVALTLAACGSPSTSGPAGGTTSGYAGFPTCVDAPTITADAALYRDEPRYGNATELVDAVMAWASALTGFEELWLDRDHHGWVTVGFHGADRDIPPFRSRWPRSSPARASSWWRCRTRWPISRR